MLKVYVGVKIGFRQSANRFKDNIHERFSENMNEKGFASAEMIALAVVGVLIAFAVYAAFKTAIGDNITNWFKTIFDGSYDTPAPTDPAGP